MTAGAKERGGRFAGEALFGAGAALAYLGLFKVLLHLFTAGNYGFYRDELYYLAASERLDLGYVDFPLFIAWLTAFTRWLLGDSPAALHFFPALAGAGVVVLAGLMARELGGGRFAQGLAALATLVAPNFLAFGTWLSMDAFDQLFWVSGTYTLLLILKRDQPKLWLLFGLITGLGLLNKVTVLFFGFAVLAALLLTPARRHLRTPWPWLGGVLSSVFLLPYLYWQAWHGWPTFEFWANYEYMVDPASPLEFLLEQTLTMHPLTLPIWLAGLHYYLFTGEGKTYRTLGWIFVILFALFAVMSALKNGRIYFLTPAYPMLFAAGALVIERFFRRRRWEWAKLAVALGLLVSGAAIAVTSVVPVLPAGTLANITSVTGGQDGIKAETRKVGELPLTFADRFGWERMAATVDGVHQNLPPEERSGSCVLAGNYGEAGAVEFFGKKYGLPRVISGHNNYYLWGPGDCLGGTIISVGVPRERLQSVFGEVERADTFTCEYCMPDENGSPIYVSRTLKLPAGEAWLRFKHYD